MDLGAVDNEHDAEEQGGERGLEHPDVYDGKPGRLLDPRLVDSARKDDTDFTRRLRLFEDMEFAE